MRLEIAEAMKRVPEVYQDCRESFTEIFGRDPGDMIQTFATDDADLILIASGSIATTAREVVRRRRDAGEKVGLVKLKMFRPFPDAALRDACKSATRVAVLDRNYAAGAGGIFCQDTRAAFQGHRDDVLIQNYLTGLCGGDVTPSVIDDILADLSSRSAAGDPIWVGIDTGEEALQ
jgi:pyruvate ferredoxin oxidoreductase alpha subunit